MRMATEQVSPSGNPEEQVEVVDLVVADLAEMLELEMVAKVVQALVAANPQQAAEDHPVPTKLIFLQVNLFNNDKYFQQLFTLEISKVGLMQFLPV